MEYQETIDQVFTDLTDRVSWENRQRVYYEMRHNGLRRKRKPGAWAADMHFPLTDMAVEKWKPFYYDQLFAAERIATFNSLVEQRPELTEQTPYWFDYKLKQHSNFLTEILYGIDHMLTSSRGILKQRWNPDSRQVVYDSVDPLMVVVPQDTKALKDAERVTLVLELSLDAYRKNEHFNQDEDFIKRIKGRQEKPGEEKWQEKHWREGLTTATDENQILLWEVWERDADNAWHFTTLAPLVPDEAVRPKTPLPYQHGRLPLFEFPREIKDKGYFAPRGEVEKLAPFEAAICKTWNEKLDAMTFYNNPLFSPKGKLEAGTHNLRLSPGKVSPVQIERVQMGQPPISYDQEMVQTRALAEQHAQLPDVGLASASGSGQKQKTAAEVTQISQVTGLSVTMRARVFRIYLAEMLSAHYRLLLQYDRGSLTYLYANTVGALPAEALHENYLIEVDSNPDSWNKALRAAKNRERLEKYKGDPFINQVELRKVDLEEDDPRLVKRLVMDPNEQALSEAELEAMEVPTLLEGFPIRVKPNENHGVRLEVLKGKMQQLAMMGGHENPIALETMKQHFLAHLQAWHESDPKSAKAYQKQVASQLQSMQGGPDSSGALQGGAGA